MRLTFPTPLQPFRAAGYRVTARDAAGKSVTDTLRVILRIMLAPTAEGSTTTRLRVCFYGFAPNERIEVRWHTNATNTSGFVVLKTLTVASNGRASSIVTIPSNAAVGRHLIADKVIGVSRSASTPFDVTAGGGSIEEATGTATPEATATPTTEASATATPVATETATATPEPTEVPTADPTPTETPSPEPAQNASPVAAAGSTGGRRRWAGWSRPGRTAPS